MDIIKKIDAMRVKRGWSFYRLSQETGISQQAFSKWLKGNTTPSVNALTSICDAFEISLCELFADGELIELTPETKSIFKNWLYLTKDEKATVSSLIEKLANKNN